MSELSMDPRVREDDGFSANNPKTVVLAHAGTHADYAQMHRQSRTE